LSSSPTRRCPPSARHRSSWRITNLPLAHKFC
jgi:hypothetical protein